MRKIIIILLLIIVIIIISGCMYNNIYQDNKQTSTLKCVNDPGQAYYPGTEKCCNGLKSVFPYELADGSCLSPEDDTRGGAPVCAPCGNNICEKEYSEDKCNCPQDCN